MAITKREKLLIEKFEPYAEDCFGVYYNKKTVACTRCSINSLCSLVYKGVSSFEQARTVLSMYEGNEEELRILERHLDKMIKIERELKKEAEKQEKLKKKWKVSDGDLIEIPLTKEEKDFIEWCEREFGERPVIKKGKKGAQANLGTILYFKDFVIMMNKDGSYTINPSDFKKGALGRVNTKEEVKEIIGNYLLELLRQQENFIKGEAE